MINNNFIGILLNRYIEIGNGYYFLYIAVTLIFILAMYIYLKNKSFETKKRALFNVLFMAFFVHFMKYFIYPYRTLDPVTRLRKISFENISATHTMLFPFVFMGKNKTLKDYLVIGGIVSGLVPILYPLDAINPSFDGSYFPRKDAFSIEVLRFYFAHQSFFIVGLLTQVLGVHKIDFRRSYRLLGVLVAILTILFVNEGLLTLLGLIDKGHLFNPNGRNPSLIFGIGSTSTQSLSFLSYFTPSFMLNQLSDGALQGWPVLWLVGPVIFFGTLFIILLYLVLDFNGTIEVLKKPFRKYDLQKFE